MQRKPRKQLRLRVDFSCSSEQETFTGHGHTLDINENGCQIESATSLPTGRYLTLRFYLPKSSAPIQVELARVRWVKARHFGVEFISRPSNAHRGPELAESVAPSETGNAHDAPARDGSHTVLVVDDNAGERVLYSRILAGAGYHALHAPDSIEAMKLCVTEPRIDVAVIDAVLTLPEPCRQGVKAQVRRVNGPQLIQDMLAIRKALRAILMSASEPAELADFGVVLNGVPFLQKPFSKEQFLEQIGNVLASPPLKWTPPAGRDRAAPWTE